MSIRDKFSDKADDAIDKLGGSDKAKEHIDKAGDAADSATGGRFDEATDKAEAAGRSAVDKLSKDERDENA